MSKWYCNKCGEESSQFGHYDPLINGFTCTPISREEKMRRVFEWQGLRSNDYSAMLIEVDPEIYMAATRKPTPTHFHGLDEKWAEVRELLQDYVWSQWLCRKGD